MDRPHETHSSIHEDAERKVSEVSDLKNTRGFVLTRQRHVMVCLFFFGTSAEFSMYVCKRLTHILYKMSCTSCQDV